MVILGIVLAIGHVLPQNLLLERRIYQLVRPSTSETSRSRYWFTRYVSILAAILLSVSYSFAGIH